MNLSHSKLADWGLGYLSVGKSDTILDVGCGGGRTVSKLAGMASEGKVYGVDYSEASVAASKKMNAREIAAGRVEIIQGSVSALPFGDGVFDLATGVETHFFWPDLPGDLREVLRVVKPGGRLLLIAEVYAGMKTRAAKMIEERMPRLGLRLLTVDEHRELLEGAGFVDVQVKVEEAKGWICATGRKR